MELPELVEAAVRVIPHGDRWIQMGRNWMMNHVISRDAAYTPQLEDGGRDLSSLTDTRITFKSYLDGRTLSVTDDWRSVPHDDDSSPWMGITTFLTSTSVGSSDSSDVPVRVAGKAEVGDMTPSRPWNGDLPPRYIYADSSFIRRDDGVWCKKDKAGRLYLVNSDGERCAKPRLLEVTCGQNHDQRRPSTIRPHVWWK